MRKSLKLALIGAAILGSLAIAGCGDNSKPSGASSTQESKLMQTIKQRGKLIVGTSSGYPPYVFVDADSPDKKVIGLDIELCKQIADKLGVQMEVQDMGFSALLSSVTSGKVDIAVGGVNPTPEREKAMAFSDIYLPTEQKLLVLKKNEHLYKDMADLDGKTIGAEKSTTQETTAQSIKGANVIGLSSVPDAILQLKNGKLDGIVVEGVVAKQYLVFNDDLMFSEVEFPNAVKSSAAAVQKGNEDVVAVVNKVIKENTDNGNFKKWTDEYSRKAVENADKQ